MTKLIFVFTLIINLSVLASKHAGGSKGDEIVFVNYEIEGSKQWVPGTHPVKAGQKVTLKLINKAKGPHGFAIPSLGVQEVLKKGETKKVKVTIPNKSGEIYRIKCHMHAAHVGGALLAI